MPGAALQLTRQRQRVSWSALECNLHQEGKTEMKRPLVKSALFALLGASQALAQNPATSVSVDANASRRAINPDIYGVCYGDGNDMAALNAPLNRWGGNSTTRYNWQIDAHSAAADWYFETYPDGSGTPGGSADAFLAATRSANNGAEPMFTIPMIDYLANLGPNRSTLEGFSVKKYGAQTATDPWNPDAGNGVSAATGGNITGNDPLDTGVANSPAIQQAWVQHFVSTLGPASGGKGVKYYILDNEPSIWYSTHRDVHPAPPTYDEIFNKMVAYATVIRAADPGAKIAGPEEWSWWAMYFSGFDQANGNSAANSDYNTHNKTYYYPWLLQNINAYKQQTGTQLIDILTVHAYNGTPDGSDDTLSGQQIRNRETRILWDPDFQDPSWYGDIGINGRVLNWIPTVKAMVAQYCPGLQIGFTEYNWGDEANLNGATTQADVLGIYGREGVDLATRWTVAKDTSTNPTTYYVTYLANQIYRNYDGNNSTFGNTSVAANVENPDNLSAFAAVRSSDGALTVMVINKQQGSTPVTVNLANFAAADTAEAWQINAAGQTAIARLADVAVTGGAITATVPSQSITLFVIHSGYQAFLQQIFPLVLGRQIDAGALSAFVAAMAGGCTRAEVYGDLIGSPEFQAWQVEPVIRLYLAAFNRIPDYAGLQNWSAALHAGALSLADAADQFATSDEFLQTFGSLDNTGFVQQLYRNVLGREADTAGLNAWLAELNGGTSRGAILTGFSESDEFKADSAAEVEVIRLYYLLKQRMPTSAELQSSIGLLKGYAQTDTLFAQAYPSGLSDAAYVQAVFQGFLRRSADTGALSAYGDALAAGTATHASLVDTIMSSDEFQQDVAPVARLYLSALLRVPDQPGLDNWVNYVRAGNTLQSTADLFASSAEFTNRYGAMDNTAYVTALYQNILGRQPDPDGLSDWVGQLDKGTATRSQVLIGFAQSQEAIALFAPTMRTFLHYFAFFNTAPTQAQLDYWKNYLTTLTDQMRESFLEDLGSAG